MEQELTSCLQPADAQKEGIDSMLKDMESLLARMG